MVDYKLVLFIRTNCFNKTIDMFKADRIQSCRFERRVQKLSKREVLPEDPRKAKYLQRDIRTIHDFCVDWDAKKHGGEFPADKIKMLIVKADIGDLNTVRVTYRFESEELSEYFNSQLESMKKQKVFTAKTCFFATFESYHGEELKNLPWMNSLNSYEIENYQFKVSSLDLKKFQTDRVWKYGEVENINVNDDKKLLYLIAKSLNYDGWPIQLRTMKDGQVVRPVAVRQYNKSNINEWTLSNQMEVIV
jgi:hypothetical protein